MRQAEIPPDLGRHCAGIFLFNHSYYRPIIRFRGVAPARPSYMQGKRAHTRRIGYITIDSARACVVNDRGRRELTVGGARPVGIFSAFRKNRLGAVS